MYFTDYNGYHIFLAFQQCLISYNNNKNYKSWTSTEIPPKKNKPFASILGPIMCNLGNGKIRMKFNSSVLVQKENII